MHTPSHSRIPVKSCSEPIWDFASYLLTRWPLVPRGASLPALARKLHFFPKTLTTSPLLRYLTCSFFSINPKQFQIQCCDLLILPCLTFMLPVPCSGFISHLPSPLFSLSLSPLSAALVFVLRLPHVLPVMTALMAETLSEMPASLSVLHR